MKNLLDEKSIIPCHGKGGKKRKDKKEKIVYKKGVNRNYYGGAKLPHKASSRYKLKRRELRRGQES